MNGPTEEQLRDAERNGVLLWKEIQDIEHIKNAVPEVLAVTGVQDGVATGLDSDDAVAVEFNFVGPIRPFGQFGN